VRVVGERPCAVGTASLFRSRAMAYTVLPRALPHNAGHHVVWRRPWSPEDDVVVASHSQRLARTASDEVALELSEDHSHVRHPLPIGVQNRMTVRYAGVACLIGNDRAPEIIPGLVSCAVAADLQPPCLPPCEGGGGFGKQPRQRGYTASEVSLSGHLVVLARVLPV
jgi:hypothetical protein